MTESLERLARRLQSASEIRELFGAMRAMAAVRLTEAQAALPGTRAFADTVAEALAEVLPATRRTAPADPRRPALVAFMPEHGFVGALAERLVDRCCERRNAATLIVVGDRGADLAEQRGLALHARLPLGAHVDAGSAVARQLADTLAELQERTQVDGVEILYPRYLSAGQSELVERRLLPLDPRGLPEAHGEPLVNLPRAELAEAIAWEWMLGELAHAVVETLASENGARLRAMDAARNSVDATLTGLRSTYRIARQDEITNEIAEVVGGVLAQTPA